jgi:FkbM family methyltransferase
VFRLKISRIIFAFTNPRFAYRRISRGAGSSARIDLEEIENHLGKVEYVFEAGASDGIDTEEMLRKFPIKEIFVFEPVHSSFLLLSKKFQSDSRVKLFNFALSDQEGFAKMNISSDVENEFGSGSSSLLSPTLHKEIFPNIEFSQEDIEIVHTTTIDSWAEKNGTNYLDLMWLDLQGLELTVLEHAERILRKTKAIHLEVARQPLYEKGCIYREIHDFLINAGFTRAIERVGYISGNVFYVRKDFS